MKPRHIVEAPFDAQNRARPKGQRCVCRWCGGEVPRGRRSWCSQACVDEYLIRKNPGDARLALFRRDRGVCAICGRDTVQLELFWRQARPSYTGPRAVPQRYYDDFFHAWQRMRTESLGVSYRATGYWDADHITPVVLGGGSCALDNLRTLCIPCHHRETARLAAELAAARQIDRFLEDL